MSSREKNLLSLLLLAGFLMLNFFLYAQFKQKKTIFQTNLATAENKLQLAINQQTSSEQYADQMQWLAEHEPKPSNGETVQSELQAFIDQQARMSGLEIKGKQDFLPTDNQGTYYHRAQIKITVSGAEQNLYRWLHTINEPTAFRSATQIRLSPNTQNETLIDCTAIISQWFQVEKSDS
jgi:hypothetical protein